MHTAFQIVIDSLHLIAAVIIVGGWFAGYVTMRAMASQYDEPSVSRLWQVLLGTFFPWVWIAILVQVVTGYALLFSAYDSLAAVPLNISLMQAIGWVTIALFVWMFFKPWREFNYNINVQNLPAAAANLNRIRKIILASLLLGLILVVIGTTGPYWQ